MRFTIQLLFTIISKVWNRTSILPFEIICLPTHSRKKTRFSKFAWVHSELQNNYKKRLKISKPLPGHIWMMTKNALSKDWQFFMLDNFQSILPTPKWPSPRWAYMDENWYVGVIFNSKQDDHKSCSEFQLFNFFGNQIWDLPISISCCKLVGNLVCNRVVIN